MKKSRQQSALEEAFDLLQVTLQATQTMGMAICWTMPNGDEYEFVNEFKKWCLKYGSLVGVKIKPGRASQNEH